MIEILYMFYISTGSMGNLIFRERMDGGTGTAEEIIQELIPLFDIIRALYVCNIRLENGDQCFIKKIIYLLFYKEGIVF